VIDNKIILLTVFSNFVTINLGLDPDPYWIRIQQQVESGSGFNKILEYGSGVSDTHRVGLTYPFQKYVKLNYT
jgi:hypothetical protein